MRITCAFGPFLPVPPFKGGAVERIFWTLCKEWARLGHEVVIISRKFSGHPDDEVVDGVRYLRIASTDAPRSRLFYRVLDALYARRVASVLPPSDVTITHSVSMPLLLSKEKAGKVYVSVGRFPKGQMWLYRHVDRLQAVSNAVANAIREQSPTVAAIVRVVPNCLSDAFASVISEPPEPRQKEVLFVGRVAREKGVHLLVRAFVQVATSFPEWRLSIVGPHLHSEGGDGEQYLTELKRDAAPVAERVAFEGAIFLETELVARYRRATVFVYPSVAVAGESFGMAPLEAMACGCATIVSDLECFKDFVSEGQNAEVFDHRDRSGAPLATALRKLITSSNTMDSLSKAGRETSRRFMPATVAQTYLDDFAELLRNCERNA